MPTEHIAQDYFNATQSVENLSGIFIVVPQQKVSCPKVQLHCLVAEKDVEEWTKKDVHTFYCGIGIPMAGPKLKELGFLLDGPKLKRVQCSVLHTRGLAAEYLNPLIFERDMLLKKRYQYFCTSAEKQWPVFPVTSNKFPAAPEGETVIWVDWGPLCNHNRQEVC